MNLKTGTGAVRALVGKAYRARMRRFPLTRFERAFSAVEPFAMVGPRHLSQLYHGVHSVTERGVPGSIVECGCARGGSAALLGLALRDLGPAHGSRKLWLYDTFEGMPEPSAGDPDYARAKLFAGQCRGDLESVNAVMSDFRLLDRVVLVKGLFADTLPHAACSPIALLHIDCDWYESVKTCLDELYEAVSPGGIVQIDDYATWQGCRRAVDEFTSSHPAKISLKRCDRASVWFQKP